jgi:GxxExxY protein
MLNENELSRIIIECAIEVHRTLGGPGLLESVYEEALIWELRRRKLKVLSQIMLPIHYKNRELGNTLRIDIMVNGLVLIECKATEHDDVIFRSQLLTYLRLSRLKLGLLINFGQQTVKNGIHRVINGL